MAGIIASFVVMNVLYWPPKIPSITPWWNATFGGEVFWPWFTLIGTAATLVGAGLTAKLSPAAKR